VGRVPANRVHIGHVENAGHVGVAGRIVGVMGGQDGAAGVVRVDEEVG